MSHFMFGTQFLTLAGRVERWSWNKSDFYGGGRFGIMIRLPNDEVESAGQQHVLTDQSLWLNVNVSEKQMGKPQYQKILQDLQTNQASFIATGCMIKTSGTGKQSLSCSIGGFRTRAQLGTLINQAILDVNCVSVTDRWLLAKESYRIPNPKQGQKNIGERQVYVYLPQPMTIYEGHPVYVSGRLAARDFTGNRNLFVIANLVA